MSHSHGNRASARAWRLGGVPSPLTALIGRASELDETLALLQKTRLLTLTGAGGSGKTHLALELVWRAQKNFRDGVAWIELAPLGDPDFLAPHLCTALGLPEDTARDPRQILIDTLRDRHVLLVLDNCEHLVDACASLVESLLRASRALTILTTSREALGIAGETTWLVPLLPVPQHDGLEHIASAASVQLFIQRARAVLPSFALTRWNGPSIADICRRLDGIPLAIELAAARVRVLSPEQIAERLGDSLALLGTGTRVRARHRTLREAIDWSVKLLTPAERTLFARLGIFAGSFSLDVVEAVCSDDHVPLDQTVDLIAALVDKSLVVSEVRATYSRYRLLETVRQFALQELESLDNVDTWRTRLAEHFAAMCEAAEPRLFGGAGDPILLAALDDEMGNIRAVGAWCRQDPGRGGYASRIGAAIHWYWFARGRFREGVQWLEWALAHAGDASPLLRAKALIARAHIAVWQGDSAAVRAPYEESARILRGLNEPATLAVALVGLAISALMEQRLEDARAHAEEALDLLRPLPSTVLEPFALHWRGIIAIAAGDIRQARELFERAVAAGRAWPHRPATAHSLYMLGHVHLQEGESPAAAACLTESLTVHREVDDRWGMVQALSGFAMLASQAEPPRAARLLGAADGMRVQLGVKMQPQFRAEYERLEAVVRGALDSQAFSTEWQTGQEMDIDALVAYATKPFESAPLVATASAVRPAKAVRRAGSGPDLRVMALGPFEVFRKNVPIAARAWGSSKARELFLLLLCQPKGSTKDRVATALWPDASPAQVRNNFHVTVHRVRRALGEGDWIVAGSDRYLINPEYQVEFDADLFEREVRQIIGTIAAGQPLPPGADATMARYRGAFLEDESPVEWLLERRDRLEQLYLEALEGCARFHAAAGRDSDAIACYRRLLERDRVNEGVCRQALKIHARMGDQAGARRAYERLVSALRAELDVDP